MNNKNVRFVLLVLISVSIFISCKEAEVFNAEEEKKQAECAIRNSIGWAKEKDLDLLYATIANDADYTEVSPEGRVTKGFVEFKQNEAFWMHPDFKAVRYEIRDLRLTLSESGTVAWFYCMLDDINEWKGQSCSWENVRWTGVLEKRKGQWRMVQGHFSYAVK